MKGENGEIKKIANWLDEEYQVKPYIKEGIYNYQFTEELSRLLDKSGVSCYKICQFSHVDQGYLSKLKNGEKNNPSPEIVMRIALAIVHYRDNVTIADIEKLFRSTGHSLRLS